MEEYLSQITNYLLTQSWQIAVLVVVIAAVSLVLKNKSAHVRYLLWLIVLAKCLVPPLISVPLAILPEEQPLVMPEMVDTTRYEPVILPSAPIVMSPAPAQPPIRPRRVELTTHQWLGLAWIAGVAIFAFVALIKAMRTHLWLRRERKALAVEQQADIASLLPRLGITTFPKVWVIDGIGQPFVWGLLRGSIYLPGDFVRIDSAKHCRDVLGHELSHVLRFDAGVNLLQIVAQAVFWFHPFVWWANKKLRQEREKCCDEMAIARLGAKVKDYSIAIVNALITEHESTRPVPSLAVAGPVRNIEERIKTIMKPGKKFYKRPSLVAAVIVLLVAVLAVPTALVLTARAETEAVVGPEEIPTKALHQAAADGDIEQVKLLISKGADVNAKDMQGRTPLHGAAFRGHKDVVGLLLAKGADVNAQDRNGRTPVDAALGRGNTKAVVKLLVARGAKVSPLHGAAYLGDLDKVKAVVEAGTDVNAKDKMGRVPLDYAATKEVAQVLIAKGSDISTEARSGRDPLYWAAFFGHKEVVEFLIAKGADVNPKDPCDYTPLEGVATEGHHDVAELLIAKGADINAGQNKTWTALHAAVAVGHKNVAELLIAEGADVNAKDRYGYTPLYLAWKRDLAELLIANGADLNAKDNQGRTPMSYWREVGTGEIADLLRKHGAKEDCIQIEAWFLLVPDDAREVKDFLEQENLESSKIQGDPNSRSYFLNAEQVEQLWELARLNTEYKLLMVPTLEVVDGKTATIRTTKATHYISGYSEPNRPSEKPEPKKDSVETGAWLTVKPKLQPDSQGTLTIDFDFEISNITGYEKLTYKGKYPYEIPIIEKVAVSAHYTVAADQTLLLCGRKITDPDDGRTEHKDLFVLIKAKKVEPKGAQVDSLPVTRD